jgi:hypothetical protein
MDNNPANRIIAVAAISGALSMFLVLIDMMPIAQYILGTSIFFLILSLALSLYEIAISTDAIEIELEDIEQTLKKHHWPI